MRGPTRRVSSNTVHYCSTGVTTVVLEVGLLLFFSLAPHIGLLPVTSSEPGRFFPSHDRQGTGGPSYIYSRYKRLGSTKLPEEAFPITFSKDGYRTPWIKKFLS